MSDKYNVELPDGLDTHTLDKLYLEWSQITSARTRREFKLEAQVRELQKGHAYAIEEWKKAEGHIKELEEELAKANQRIADWIMHTVMEKK